MVMPRGGPAPKPEGQRRRRNASPSTVKLPKAGRAGRAPKWPMIEDIVTRAKHDLAETRLAAAEFALQEAMPAQRPALQVKVDRLEETLAILAARLKHQRRLEAALWRDLWKLPQAVEWERLGWTREVGQYVRWKVLAELGELDAGKEARQYADRIGLSPMSLLRLRWEIVDDEPPAALASVSSIETPRRRPMVTDEA